MELRILNSNFDDIDVLDNMTSAIWTDRYYYAGDVEITNRVEPKIIQLMDTSKTFYLANKDSNHTMIVEDISLNTDAEYGDSVTVTGRSLETILARRIVWEQTTLSGDFQNAMLKLLNENVIQPSIGARKINNFVFKASDDPYITSLKLPGEGQYHGQNLYDLISTLCEILDVGFKVTLDDQKRMVFEMYSGTDRSYDQTKNDPILFAPKMDNLITSNYYQSNTTYKNVVLVAGEGEGTARKTATFGSAAGIDRREIFEDARDISTNSSAISDTEYIKLLRQRGNEVLLENNFAIAFEGGVEMTKLYKYNKDVFMGDIVQLRDKYGMEAKVRIIEVVNSQKGDTIERFPTFKYIE